MASGIAGIFKLDAPLPFGGSAVLQSTSARIEASAGSCTTGAAVTATGDGLAVTYDNQNVYRRRSEGQALETVLGATDRAGGHKCMMQAASESQREAITFSRDGRNVFTTSEKVGSKIWRY